MVTRNICTADSNAMAGSPRWHTGEISELERGIGAYKTGIGIVSAIVPIIDDDVDVVHRSTVVVDLAQDARGQILGERGVRATRAIGRVGIDRQTMLLLLGSGAVDDVGDIEDRGEGQTWVAVDNHQEVMRISEGIHSRCSACCSEFIAAQISAGWIRKGSPVRGCLAGTDADGPIIIRRRT